MSSSNAQLVLKEEFDVGLLLLKSFRDLLYQIQWSEEDPYFKFYENGGILQKRFVVQGLPKSIREIKQFIDHYHQFVREQEKRFQEAEKRSKLRFKANLKKFLKGSAWMILIGGLLIYMVRIYNIF